MDPLKKFGPIWGASGIQGFKGEGYPYHRYSKLAGFNLTGLTFTAKTSTLEKNPGNMPLEETDRITPKEFLPRCIYVSPRSWWHGSALNAVALSGPGIGFLIEKAGWKARKEPFFISIMMTGKTPEDRLIEVWEFHKQIQRLLFGCPHLQNIIGLQINYSCPNTDHDIGKRLEELVMEIHRDLAILRTLEIPLVPKISILLPLRVALEIGDDPNCDGITLSNTIPWDDLPKVHIDRGRIFGEKYKEISPLTKRGFTPGGYSGIELAHLVANYVKSLRYLGFKKHINAGGGLLYPQYVDWFDNAGANSFSIGSVAFLRPWETGRIIKRAYEIKGVPFPV